LLDTLGRRKLPAIDSKAAIRDKREKEIQMKVRRVQKIFFRRHTPPHFLAGPAAAEKIARAE
jgi:hypothetical protein